jgi:hypothetical protein
MYACMHAWMGTREREKERERHACMDACTGGEAPMHAWIYTHLMGYLGCLVRDRVVLGQGRGALYAPVGGGLQTLREGDREIER